VRRRDYRRGSYTRAAMRACALVRGPAQTKKGTFSLDRASTKYTMPDDPQVASCLHYLYAMLLRGSKHYLYAILLRGIKLLLLRGAGHTLEQSLEAF